MPIGDSDHMATLVSKFSKYNLQQDTVIRKRLYKHFNTQQFLEEIRDSHINYLVTQEQDIEVAAQLFNDEFLKILDKHAPLKNIQV